MSDGRLGNWMQTVGGRAFYPLDPRTEDIDIEDIAHALSSVAEHSVRVSNAVEVARGTTQETLHALLHDAAEAYLGDMIWPLKQAREMALYKTIEHQVEAMLAVKFGLVLVEPAIVKHFDLVLLSTEKRDLVTNDRTHGAAREVAAAKEKLGAWHSDGHAPLPEKIVPWTIERARRRFLDRFGKLKKRRDVQWGKARSANETV